MTLRRSHLGHAIARSFGEKLRQEQIALLLRITEHDEQRPWDIFVRYDDKKFSFTDCTSFALMERLHIMVLSRPVPAQCRYYVSLFLLKCL